MASWPARRREHLVAPETADLIRSLKKPRRLTVGGAHRKAIARLVLDGLLEIEERGRFRSGTDACGLFFSPARATRRRDQIGTLSFEALRSAASLGPRSPAYLRDRLYRYNSRPISPAWRRRFPDEGALRRFLDLDRLPAGSRRSRSMAGIISYAQGTWQAWDVPRARTPLASAPRFKLYVSPDPASTGSACSELRGLLGSGNGPFSMKVGRELGSLLRPDRLVAYFARHHDLLETAERLRRALDGVPAQGVPFTASLSADGLLSWGADIPVSSPLGSGEGERSWRAWLVSRLAEALANGYGSTAVSPIEFALARVSLDGVNTTTWAPTTGLLGLAGRASPTDADS